MTRTFVVIINGAPKSGKDAFCNLCKEYCDMDESANVLILSSVDPIKETLKQFGWDGNKTDEARNLIANIKQLWMKTGGPTTYLFNNIFDFHKNHYNEDNIVFCHIREPEEINILNDMLCGFDAIGIYVTTLLITREQADHSNQRDADNVDMINSYDYAHRIENNGDHLYDLSETAEGFVDYLLDERR